MNKLFPRVSIVQLIMQSKIETMFHLRLLGGIPVFAVLFLLK